MRRFGSTPTTLAPISASAPPWWAKGSSRRRSPNTARRSRSSPTHSSRNKLGFVLLGQGKVAEAIAEYRAAIPLYPDPFVGHSTLVNALISHGRLAEAIAEGREMIRLKPDSALAHNTLGGR